MSTQYEIVSLVCAVIPTDTLFCSLYTLNIIMLAKHFNVIIQSEENTKEILFGIYWKV